LTDVFVTDVQFDRTGRLWVATDGGAVVWRDPLEVEFHSILAGATELSTHGLGYVRLIRFDHDGRLWIGISAARTATTRSLQPMSCLMSLRRWWC
jgi:ligand-binding sensor domain-containing protein